MSHIVTVVIPVYNVEKYLEQCLHSATHQTLKDIEIICINDGSTDNSKKILEQFASQDNRIKIINQKNEGLSKARNVGIKNARGKYITFLDADDYFSLDALEKMVAVMENYYVDLVIAQAHAFADTEADEKRLKSIEEWLKIFVKEKGIYNIRANDIPITCWAQLLKTEILRKNNILFPDENLVYEDEYWRYAHSIHCRKYFYLPEKIYNYRIRSNSITGHEPKTAQPLDIIRINYLIAQEIYKRSKWEKYQPQLEQMFRSHIHTATIKSGRVFYEQAQKKIKELLSFDSFSQKFRNRIQQYLSDSIPFSIIIPVYNTAPYLRQCLDSIISQTIDLFEIICINDGSTDESLEILNEYASKYDNIKIVSQMNQGVSVARNKGLEIAKGRYILFVDSDDFIEPNLLEETYRKMQFDELDWLLFGLRYYNEKQDKYEYTKYYSLPDRLDEYNTYKGTKQFNTLINLPGECSNKVFCRKLIIENNLEFDTDIQNGEDIIFNMKYLLAANKFGVLKKIFYNYRYPRADSLCQQKKSMAIPMFSLEFINALGLLALTQEDSHIQKNLAHKYLRYLEQILSLPLNNIEQFYDKFRLILKNHKPILHKYKTFDERTCKMARFIIKNKFGQYKRKLKYIKIMQSKFVKRIKHCGNFIKSYILFPWYIYQIYTNNLNNKAPR